MTNGLTGPATRWLLVLGCLLTAVTDLCGRVKAEA